MAKWKSNSVVNPNPFGPTSEMEVIAFEKRVGAKLPDEYRSYLIQFNGGKLENDYFERAGRIDGRVHGLYGLHAGPNFSKLEENWKLSDYYDIGESAPGVNEYIVFADTETGDLLLLSLKNGEVFFLDHESIEDDPEYGARFNAVPIAKNFDEFVESLMPASMIPD